MKRRIARVLCGIMAAQLVLPGAVFHVSAEENEILNEEILQEEILQEEVSSEPAAVKNSLTVNLKHASVNEKEQSFKIYLKDSGYENATVLNPGNGIIENAAVFNDLEDGTYILRIESPGFASYEQEIIMEGYKYTVNVATGQSDTADAGLMPYGDLNQDGIVDKADATAVVDAIENGAADEVYDINSDGAVNLKDLEKAVTLFYDVSYVPETARVIKSISTESVQGSVPESTVQEGNIEDLLSGSGSVTLSPAGDGAVISEETPVEMSFDFSTERESVELEGFVLQTPAENRIASGAVEVTYLKDGQERTGLVIIGEAKARSAVEVIGTAESAQNGELTIRLNGQIAVKKVTIKITSMTQHDASLAEITNVEFLNNMEDHIPAPVLDIPEVTLVEAGNKTIRVQWNKVTNITGYQVLISLDDYTEYINTTETSAEITMFRNKSLENKKTYTIAVQSVNGDWKSGYEQTYSATPRYDSIPDAPDSLKLSSDYRQIHASWNAPKDNSADSYTLYYKKQGDDNYQSITGITAANYSLYDLDDETEYTIYVTAVNEYGEGPASLEASIKTKSMKPVKFSQYRIINSASEEGELTAHIKSITRRQNVPMYNSLLDEGSAVSALGIADNNFESYYQINDWDDAVAYHTGNEGWGLTVELDQVFKMNRFAIAAPDDSTYYTAAAVYYWDDGVRKKAEGMSFQRKTDENGRAYYEIKLSSPVETDRVQFGLQVSYYGVHKIQVAELRLYEYDSLEDDIRALYEDDLYISIRDDIKEEDFDGLQERIDAKVNGDYHPERSALQAELDAARKLFEEQKQLNDVLYISTDLSAAYDSALKTSGLNAWQPLGISAEAGDEIVVYVGAENGKQGSTSKLQLVVTQQHAENDQLSRTINLNVGRNVITIPELVQTDVEKGGALYVQYTGNNSSEQYAVRVNGGERIPVLNLRSVTDEAQRKELINVYVDELKTYCEALEENHKEDHGKKVLFFSLDTYDEKTCIYNTTDIVLDHMMISGPATQILAGLGNSGQTEKLKYTVDAMDDMLVLFYQHKGLTENFEEGTDQSVVQKNHIPSQHLNIRYMKMFSGAFMYAGGNHIGIEWDSIKELILNEAPVVDENGKLVSGNYFGWGIAHEIGHQINQGEYTIAEVTNNYFALLAQADGTNGGVRFSYEDVYDKVTSNTVGYPSDVFTQLAMYWQLHLAYDSDFAQKTYADYQEAFENLLFARVDTYARNPEAFNAEGREVTLTLTGDKDQNLMRLVSAAAEKNLSEFFIRWGYVPDEETSQFMSQFEAESRAVYYINDDAKTADIEKRAQSFENQNVITDIELTVDQSDVEIKITPDENYPDQVLGYEIVRVTTKKGNVEKEVLGFTTNDTYTDTVSLGSRAVSYEVYAVDLLTNRSAVMTTDSVKVVSDGKYGKDQFTVTSNMVSELDHTGESDANDPCEPETESAVKMVIDNDKSTEYIGTAEKDPYVLIDLKQTLEVSALRYWAESDVITDYKIEVSTDGNEYMTVSEGTFSLEGGQDTVYFTNGSDPWVVTYDIRCIKITATGQAGENIGIKEFDILGPSGDNVEFTDDNGKATIGILANDYVYDKETNQKIPAGSVVFAGSYKGNPAYNVVVLYDQDGAIVGGTNAEGELMAQQIILAPDPGDALLGEVSEGTWIYWIEPDQEFSRPSQVKAELYRVDNAMTNEGERLTSDTVYINVPDQLEEIEIVE